MSRPRSLLVFGAVTVLAVALVIKWVTGAKDPAGRISDVVTRAGGQASGTVEAGLSIVQEGIGAASDAGRAVVEGDAAGHAKDAVRRVTSPT